MNKEKKSLLLLPVVFVMAVVPLIVHMYVYHSNLSQYNWYTATDQETDFFLYYKALAIVVIAVIMCAALVYQYIKQKKEFRFDYIFMPLFVYAVFTLFSSLFSEYKYFCFHGIMEMFESLWVLLGYCVIAFYTYQLVRTGGDVMFVMKWFTVGVLFMLCIGVSQAAGCDFYKTRLGKMLITVREQWSDLDSINFTFEKGRVYLSVYNPNYVATYFALVIPVLLALLIAGKKIVLKILYICMILASLVCLLASGNRSGIVAFAVTGALAVALFWKQIRQRWKVVVPVAAAFILVVVVFTLQNDYIVQKFLRLFQAAETTEDAISEIVTGDEDISIVYRGNVLKVAYDQTEEELILSVTDGDGNSIAYDAATGGITDERFPGFAVKAIQMPDENIGLDIFADNIDWCFEKGEDGTYYYYNPFGRLDKINNAPRVAVSFLERKFEERGTIWSKTIPLLKRYLLFGSGADTFALEYPQDDYVDKRYDGSMGMIDVKPHSFYLQVAVQSGFPALLAILVFYIWYFVRSIKLYWKASYKEPMEIVGAGLWLATFTYMVISTLNDSTVNVAPIFWAIMGLGIAVNAIIREQRRAAMQAVETAETVAELSVTAAPKVKQSTKKRKRKKK